MTDLNAKRLKLTEEMMITPYSTAFVFVTSQMASLGTVGSVLSDMWWGPQE